MSERARLGLKVKYTGCNDDQAAFGSDNDPRSHLTVGTVYEVVSMDEHSSYTNLNLKG